MRLKRLFDIATSFLALVLLIPFFLVIAVFVKFESPGSVLFIQRRVGKNGIHFPLMKFRTMHDQQSKKAPLVTSSDDERITKVGKFLRKYKLDELPQLLNVLLGDMSLVGPRPEVQKFVDTYPAALKKIVLSVRPGITDLGTLKFIDEESLLKGVKNREELYINDIIPKKLAYSVEYIESRTNYLDLKIIFKTLAHLIWKQNR